MADSQQAAARNQEIQEIEDELCFQNGLLQSIDDAVEDKDNAILEVKKEILALQKKLKRLRRGPNSLSSSQASASKATPSKKRNTKPQGVTESMNGYTSKFTSFLMHGAAALRYVCTSHSILFPPASRKLSNPHDRWRAIRWPGSR